jgi:diphosphomevalonate decarboxylase
MIKEFEKIEAEYVKSSAKGPINIALVKYWGKEDEDRLIPLNNSISITLDMEECYTFTEARVYITNTNEEECSVLYLNGKKESISRRLETLINIFRNKCEDKNIRDGLLVINSVNMLPTAAGCASSASSMSCIVKVLNKLFLNNSLTNTHLSALSRLGSGSACRSIFGGFVEWQKFNEDLKDSVAVQIVDKDYWDDICVMLIIVSDKKKETSSTEGMKVSKETSLLLKYRVAEIVPKRIDEMKKAILEKDFDSLCELSMKDSNNFHAVCRDTYPTITYMNDTSNLIVKCVEKLNTLRKHYICAYTFDAGPNAFIIYKRENKEFLNEYFSTIFGLSDNVYTTMTEEENILATEIRDERTSINSNILKIVNFNIGNGVESVDN